MEQYQQTRPRKTVFPPSEQKRLRDLAILAIKKLFLPDENIIKILLIGSSVKGAFGQYEAPGFRGSLFSDFDFLVVVNDDYQIPPDLEREASGKPFQNEDLDQTFRKRRIVEDAYDAEIFFLRENQMRDPQVAAQGEAAGIPMDEVSTQNPFIKIYDKNS